MNMQMSRAGFQAPSGRMFLEHELLLLRDLERNGTIAWGDEVVFNSGFVSRVYFRGRNDLTDNPLLLKRVASVLKGHIDSLPLTHGLQKCLIGVPVAGTPLAQAVSELSLYGQGLPICFRLMRSLRKLHGKDQMWVGEPDLAKHSYITVENVVSTAESMLRNFRGLEEDRYPTRDMHHVVFASWGLGGDRALSEAGYHNIHILYHVLDIIAAFVHMEMWAKSKYDLMAERVTAFNAQQQTR